MKIVDNFAKHIAYEEFISFIIIFLIPGALQFTSMIFAYIKQKDNQKRRAETESNTLLDNSLDGLSSVESDYSFFEPLLVVG